MKLVIDPEFAEKIPALTKEEFDQLEANILAEGRIIDPLIIWNGIIVDGHNRLRIIRERVRSGMRNAAAKGAKLGRPQTTIDDIPNSFLRHYPAYKNGAFNLTELARLCNISRTTAYKWIGLLE